MACCTQCNVPTSAQAATMTTTTISLKLTLLLPLLIFFAIVFFHTNLANIKTHLSHFYIPQASNNAQQESTFLHPDATFTGYIISSNEHRYNHSKTVLTKLGITSHQHTPLPYNSTAIHDAMLNHYDSNNIESKYRLTSKKYKKFLSNRLAFTALFQEFLNDPVAELASWRFFFEDDIALHPFLTPSLAREVLSRGLEVAAGDGMVYLGICGASQSRKEKKVVLRAPVEGRRCSGTCSHALGVTKWKAGGVMAFMENLLLKKMEEDGPEKKKTKRIMMCFDQVLKAYGEQVHPVWVLGSNLWSPQDGNHLGMVFQDRRQFPSGIDEESDNER